MKHNGFVRVNFHGEAEELTDEEVTEVVVPFKTELEQLTEDKRCDSCMYV